MCACVRALIDAIDVDAKSSRKREREVSLEPATPKVRISKLLPYALHNSKRNMRDGTIARRRDADRLLCVGGARTHDDTCACMLHLLRPKSATLVAPHRARVLHRCNAELACRFLHLIIQGCSLSSITNALHIFVTSIRKHYAYDIGG